MMVGQPADTVKGSHRVIECIDWFLDREKQFGMDSHSMTMNHISQRIVDMLTELKDNEYKFLDTFNQAGVMP